MTTATAIVTDPTTDERVATRMADLTNRRAAILDDDALPAFTTRGELATIQRQRAELDRQIADVRSAVAAVAALGSAEDDEQWRDHLTNDWRPPLCDELLALKSPIRDPVTKGKALNLTLSLKCIDVGLGVLKDTGYDLTTLRLGELMLASGFELVGADPDRNFIGRLPWFGSIKEVEKRIATLAKQRANAEAALEAALLTDDERAAKDAAAKAERDALNALQIVVSRDGSSLVAYKTRQDLLDDNPYPPEDMSAIERRAFDKMRAAFR